MSLTTTAKKQLVLLGVLIVAIVALINAFRGPMTQPSADAGQKVVEAFFTKIREGHPDHAWDSTTAEFKSARGKEAFASDVKKRAYLKESMQFFAVNTVTVQNQPRSEYLFRNADGNAKTNTRVVIGREGSEWKVDLCIFPD